MNGWMTSPLVWISLISLASVVVGLIFGLGQWKGKVDADRARFREDIDADRTMFKEFMREIRTDIKKILRTVAVARDLKQQSSRID